MKLSRILLLTLASAAFAQVPLQLPGPVYVQPSQDHSAAQGLLLLDAAGVNGLGLISPATAPAGLNVWSLPVADGVGCVQSDGAWHLLISGCSGSGTSVANGFIVTGNSAVPTPAAGFQVGYNATSHVTTLASYDGTPAVSEIDVDATLLKLEELEATSEVVFVPGGAITPIKFGMTSSDTRLYVSDTLTHNIVSFVGGATPTVEVYGSLQIDTIASGTQCLHANSSGAVSGTGSDCGSGSGTGVTNGFTMTGNSAVSSVATGFQVGYNATSHVTTLASYDGTPAVSEIDVDATLLKLAELEATSEVVFVPGGAISPIKFGMTSSDTHLYVSDSLSHNIVSFVGGATPTVEIFNSLQIDTIASGTQCLHADLHGNVTGTGSDCGTGSGVTVANGFKVTGNSAVPSAATGFQVGYDPTSHVTTLASYDGTPAVSEIDVNATLLKLAELEATSEVVFVPGGAITPIKFGMTSSDTHLYVSDSLSHNIVSFVGGATPTVEIFNSLQIDTIASGTQCLHANSSGAVSGTGSDCGSGGGGGSTEIYLQAKRDCGMHVDGTTDDTALLSACVASTLPAAGGTILIGPGQVKLASTLTITKNHVTLQGVGGMGSDDPDDVNNGPATQLVCGASPCIVFQGATNFPNNPPNQPYNQNVITGTGLRNLGMYGQSAYATALKTIDEWNAIPLQNVTIRDFNGGYAVLVTSDVNEASCSSRHLIFDNVKFASTNGTNTAASGIQFGEYSAGHEVCSMEVSNLISELSEAPGTHQILLDNTDTSTFSNLNLGGAGSTIVAVATIVADPSGSNPTVTTSSPHGMPVTGVDDGVYLVAGCSTPTSAGACGGTIVQQLNGSLAGRATGASTIVLDGVTGLTPNGTYYAAYIGGTSLQLNHLSGPFSFGQVYTLNGVGAASTAGMFEISGWNWNERCWPPCDFNAGYARLPVNASAIDVRGNSLSGSKIMLGTNNAGDLHIGAQIPGTTLAERVLLDAVGTNGAASATVATFAASGITFAQNVSGAGINFGSSAGCPTACTGFLGDSWWLQVGTQQLNIFGQVPYLDRTYTWGGGVSADEGHLMLSDSLSNNIMRINGGGLTGQTQNANDTTVEVLGSLAVDNGLSFPLYASNGVGAPGTATQPSANQPYGTAMQFAYQNNPGTGIGNNPSQFVFDVYDNGLGNLSFPAILLRRCDGPATGCLPVQINEPIASIGVRPYGASSTNGWAPSNTAGIVFTATTTQSSVTQGAEVIIQATGSANYATRQNVATFTPDGSTIAFPVTFSGLVTLNGGCAGCGGGVSLSTPNTWTATQSFDGIVMTSGYSIAFGPLGAASLDGLGGATFKNNVTLAAGTLTVSAGSVVASNFVIGSLGVSSGGAVAAATNFTVNGTAGVNCSGTPSSSFAVTGGIVTHC